MANEDDDVLRPLPDSIRGTPTAFELPTMLQVHADDADSGGFLVVLGPDLSDVEVGSHFDYAADGSETASWKPLAAEGGVWVAEVNPGEMRAVKLRGREKGKLRPIEGAHTLGGIPGQGPAFSDVMARGADPDVVTCAAMSFSPEQGGFPDGSRPVLGGSPKLGKFWYGVAVAEAPGGGYLVGSCPTLNPEWHNSSGSEDSRGYVLPAPAGGSDDLLTVLPVGTDRMSDGDESLTAVRRVLVVAPKDAATVTVNGVTAQVQDRIAVIQLPPDVEQKTVRVVAHDASGHDIGSAGIPRGQGQVEWESFYDTPWPGFP
jgi:hypothetical protein